ncbi:MAG: Ldh family oxidoreductase [Myxococcota bacterium]
MNNDIHWVKFDKLEKFMKDVFIKLGVPTEDAAVCADVLITSDKRGIDSHGIGRMKTIYYDRIRAGIQFPVTNFEVVKDRDATAVVDGHDGMGHLIAKKSMQMAIDKAKNHGLGMVVTRNSTHYGICGYYALMAIKSGMIGFTGTNARPSIAPTHGVENMLGTNPFTFGLPTDEEFPFLFDGATSVSQRGKIEVYNRAEKEIPEGWVIDRKGEYRTDTKQILADLVKGKAALTPLGGMGETRGGHKGYSYATLVEILSAALQNGSCLKQLLGWEDDKRVPYHLGHFFIAIDIEHFINLDLFRKIAGNILRELRNSEVSPKSERIYTAGEKEYLAEVERTDKGAPINKNLQKEINEMREKMKLKQYSFPWDKTH